MSLFSTWKDLRQRGVMGINQRNADYVLRYNQRHLYPLVDDKIKTKERALEVGIHVPTMYGVIDSDKGISKLKDIVKGRLRHQTRAGRRWRWNFSHRRPV
jgi:predicted component of type VI protein secretion system